MLSNNDKLKIAAVNAFAEDCTELKEDEEKVVEYLKRLMLKKDRHLTISVTRKAGGRLIARAVYPTQKKNSAG